MQEQRALLHRTLSGLFNDVLRIEEKALSVGEFTDLSVREMHVIETVANAGEENSMSALAAKLGITVGSLTVAVSTLVRKGYLERTHATYDRRIVQIGLTEKGQRANAHHNAFHEDMVEALLQDLSPEQMELVMRLFSGLEDYLSHYIEDRV